MSVGKCFASCRLTLFVYRSATSRHGRLRVLGGQWDGHHAVSRRPSQRGRSVQRRSRLPPITAAWHVPGATRPAVGRRGG